MLIKEYRIALPMSVDEYRIAQLYMIQKKSREESEGAGSGVEILRNEPYTNGPGGNGQFTYKIYHIGSHLPSWFRAILPKSALRVEEEAWNAYPYTKTRYRCPFVEKFTLEIETRYLNDAGEEENVFQLSSAEQRQRTVDVIDIVKDSVTSDYKKEEDPKIYKSSKTGRGPLTDNWRSEYSGPHRGKSNVAIMTAYKLCKVEFRYWGMQSKIERFIHDTGLRRTMLRAHRQAWCWQDEWYGLQLADIRQLELETQRALAEKMAVANEGDSENVKNQREISNGEGNTHISNSGQTPSSFSATDNSVPNSVSMATVPSDSGNGPYVTSSPSRDKIRVSESFSGHISSRRRESWGSRHSLNASSSNHALDLKAQSIEQLQESSSEEEFFDAQEMMEDEECDVTMRSPHLMRSTSMEMISTGDEYLDTIPCTPLSAPPQHSEPSFVKRVEFYSQLHSIAPSQSLDSSMGSGPYSPPSSEPCKTTVLLLVLHGGNVLDHGQEHVSKYGDFNTLKTTMETAMKAHYPAAVGHIAFRLVPCPHICMDILRLLFSLSPYSFDTQHGRGAKGSEDEVTSTQEFLPLGAIALFATSCTDYQDNVNAVIAKANNIYNDFLKSEEGRGFMGQVCVIADSTGSLLTYEALCRSNPHYSHSSSHHGSHSSLTDVDRDDLVIDDPLSADSKHLSSSDTDLAFEPETPIPPSHHMKYRSKSEIVPPDSSELHRGHSMKRDSVHLSVSSASAPHSRRTSTGSQSDSNHVKFDFDVADVFMFGSPLAIVLAYRKLCCGEERHIPPLRPACHQIYNLFHSRDPLAARLEPLLHERFKYLPAVKVPRYNKFPLGDGEPIHVVEAIQSHSELFGDNRRHSNSPSFLPSLQRQNSTSSIISQVSGLGDVLVSNITNVTSRWWGSKRLDHVLYCPDALHSFPTTALPHLFHSSFWESMDVAAFILRQIVRVETFSDFGFKDGMKEGATAFSPSQPREKWLRRRTTIKVKNLTPNHRANDVIVLEDTDQQLHAKFMYGPLDMTALTGEKVDIHVMTQPPSGEWVYYGMAITDSHGRLTFTVPTEQRLTQGMYPVKMIVRGDHTYTDFFLTVLPPKTETVVFSIDGSFTASVSIMGKDPKVRAGAVDVVRHWQELGYLILYVTARPDMQHKKVVTWMAQHNFPHGMVAFMDGLCKDPLRQKLNFLKSLQTEANVEFKAAYGSSKDIAVYKELGLQPSQIYIVGKASKKQHTQGQILTEGYAVHLNGLTSPGGSRPAVGNARLFIRKSCFSLPNQSDNKRLARRTASLPHRGRKQGTSSSAAAASDSTEQQITIAVSDAGNTVLESNQSMVGRAVRARGTSPRPKIPTFSHDSVV